MGLVMCKGCRKWLSFLNVEDCQDCHDVLIGNYWSQDNDEVLKVNKEMNEK